MALEPGQRVNDYEILSVLGAGGMGRVFCVRNTISGRTEAMKILLPDLSAEPELAHRFTSEIRTLASFDHPNIAQLRTAFQYDNQLVMIMEYVEGVSLEQQAKQGAMPQADVVGYMSQVLSALSYAHSHGVVHRDIKPANMMVTSHGIVKLMDFGIAKSSNEPQLTRPGMTMGSMYYMSPEQVRGTNVDARSDIYSVGITLYELLAGRRPFEAQTTFSILNQQLNEIPTPPVQINPALPKALNDIILMALAKDPDLRFRTADAFRNALRPFLPELQREPERIAVGAAAPLPPFVPVPVATPVMNVGDGRRSSGRRGLWIGMGAVAALVAMIAAATMIPHFVGTHAASTTGRNDSGKSDTGANIASAPTPSSQVVPASPAAQTTATSDNQPAAKAVGAGPAEDARAVSTKLATEPSRPLRLAERGQSEPRSPLREAYRSGPRSTGPEPQGSGSDAQAPQPQTTASREAVEQASERLLQLEARSSAASQSIDSLRRRQEEQGLGLRADVTASLSRMNAHTAAANRAIQEHDLAAANRHMEQAEGELQTLERFMGK